MRGEMMDRLKPCPICGASEIEIVSAENMLWFALYAQCEKCKYRTMNRTGYVYTNEIKDEATREAVTKIVVDDWNTRIIYPE